MIEILIRCEILKAVEWLGGPPKLVASLRGASKRRLYDALELLGADRELLVTVGSWLDTWTDDEVLTTLREWNARTTGDTLEKVRQSRGAIKPPAESGREFRQSYCSAHSRPPPRDAALGLSALVSYAIYR